MALPRRDLELRSAVQSLPSLLVCCACGGKGEQAILAGLALSSCNALQQQAVLHASGDLTRPLLVDSARPLVNPKCWWPLSLPPPADPNHPTDHDRREQPPELSVVLKRRGAAAGGWGRWPARGTAEAGGSKPLLALPRSRDP